MSTPAIIYIVVTSILLLVIGVHSLLGLVVADYKKELKGHRSFKSAVVMSFGYLILYWTGGIFTLPLSIPAILILVYYFLRLSFMGYTDGREYTIHFPFTSTLFQVIAWVSVLYWAGFFN